MSSLPRRSVIVSVGGIVCAGCAGSDESSLTLEFEISGFQRADEFPDGVVKHPNPRGFRWIVVAVDVTQGEIPSGDLYGLTQIGVGDATEPARAIDVEDGPLVAGADGPTIEGGGGADIYYRLSVEEAEGDIRWVTDQLENEHRGINLSKIQNI